MRGNDFGVNMDKIIRKIELWKCIESWDFPTKTKQMRKYEQLKREFRDGYKIRVIKFPEIKLDETLTGIEKQESKYREELPKLSHEERLKRFKFRKDEKEVK